MVKKIDPIYLRQTRAGGFIVFKNERGVTREYNRSDDSYNINGEPDVWGFIVPYDRIIPFEKATEATGISLWCCRDGHDNDKYDIVTNDGYCIGQYRDGQHMGLWIDFDGVKKNPDDFYGIIAEYAASNPEVIKHIPLQLFLSRETLSEEILSAYQSKKLEELKNLQAGADFQKFTETVKAEVDSMEETFSKVENARNIHNNFSSLFTIGS